jgi:protein gp37
VRPAFIAQVFDTMARCPQHTFQVLTKRPQRMRSVLNGTDAFGRTFMDVVDARMAERDERLDVWPWPNVWLGTSVENQRYADLRIPHLLATPAAVRFLSIEPLLGPVDLSPWISEWWRDADSSEVKRALDWVICGGESGPGARPMHPQWVRDLRDQCVAAGVPWFFKQWGAWAPGFAAGPTRSNQYVTRDGATHPIDANRIGDKDPVAMHRWGKKAAGRELDGRTWDEMPA